MNAAQSMALAQALADALDKAGIAVERASFRKGNLREYERMESLDVAARTIGAWLSWSWVPSVGIITPPPVPSPTSNDPVQSHLRLVHPEVNNDDADDGA
jgi:hypothetical protein